MSTLTSTYLPCLLCTNLLLVDVAVTHFKLLFMQCTSCLGKKCKFRCLVPQNAFYLFLFSFLDLRNYYWHFFLFPPNLIASICHEFWVLHWNIKIPLKTERTLMSKKNFENNKCWWLHVKEKFKKKNKTGWQLVWMLS